MAKFFKFSNIQLVLLAVCVLTVLANRVERVERVDDGYDAEVDSGVVRNDAVVEKTGSGVVNDVDDAKKEPVVIVLCVVGAIVGLSAMTLAVYFIYSHRKQNPNGFNFFPQTSIYARSHVPSGHTCKDNSHGEQGQELLPV